MSFVARQAPNSKRIKEPKRIPRRKTRRTCENIKAILKAAGTALKSVVSAFLRDIYDLQQQQQQQGMPLVLPEGSARKDQGLWQALRETDDSG
jgi:enamine deaminase RidA (YjgF/YER057c/UK114 family)